MIPLTRQERWVIVFLAAVILAGSLVEYVFKRYPAVARALHFAESEGLYPQIDVNRASREELVALPYIGEYTARRILERREARGPFQSVGEIAEIKGVRQEHFKIFSKYLRVIPGDQ